MKTRLLPLIAVLALVGFAAPALHAQDAGLKQRMSQRLSSVDDLRRRQVVGETNTGFLEVRGVASAEEQRIVADENADRAAVYKAIAARSETTPETVGKARAKQIAAASARGVLVQDEFGRWEEKR